MDVRKVVDKINKQKTKMNKLRQFVLDRKKMFLSRFWNRNLMKSMLEF